MFAAQASPISPARADFSGDLKGLTTTPSIGLKYQAGVNDPGKLFRFLGLSQPISMRELSKVNLSGSVDGTLEALAVKSDIAAAGAKIAIEGNVKQIMNAPTLMLGIAINHPELAQFVRLAAPDLSLIHI